LPKLSEGVTLEQLWAWHFASEPVAVACTNQHSDHYLKDTLHFKRVSIHTQPELLIIQLKRFEQHRKLRNNVFFPLILDCVQPQKSLQAVVVHLGASLSSGHYVTFVRTPQGWYRFDDIDVTSVSLSEMLSTEVDDIHVTPASVSDPFNVERDCYLLFYM